MSEHLAVHAGAQVSHYVLKEPLGQGNLTQTWRAVDHRDGSEVALRIFSDWLSHAPETRDKLGAGSRDAPADHSSRAGADRLRRVSRREIGPAFLATPFIPGASLMRRLAAQGPFTASDALHLLEPVLDVVAVLHNQGIVHENIRPSNIVIDLEGKAHLTDSDLSRVVDMPGPPLPGSFEYMSPERLANQKTTPSSDIYSIGCVLYEMLAGVPPFTGTAEKVRTQQQDEKPMPVLLRNADVPGDIASIVMRCLEKEPANRFENGADLESALGLAKPCRASSAFGGSCEARADRDSARDFPEAAMGDFCGDCRGARVCGLGGLYVFAVASGADPGA